eukprot:TRINITY_DN28820_c0_g1_i1.p1 TRINITY_DN28820_c0_g1~~TRINITY_DN28820_c0_g1_i1.p1  ORF type:complete len:650 (+),score=115.19 TRINITY_DN28820_c0_g1_i1:50-1999(+)
MQNSQPATAFDPSCGALIAALGEAVRQELPAGWSVRPFGSFVQGTGLPGACLDVAIYIERSPGAPAGARQPPGLEINPVQTMAVALQRRTSTFTVISPVGASGELSATEPVRLLAGDFSESRRVGRQEIALYHGDDTTGVFDMLLRRVLDTDPSGAARSMVLLVKRWIRNRHFRGRGLGGSYEWTLLAVFFLQTHGMLPPLQQVVLGQAPRSSGGLSTVFSRDPEMLLRAFVESYLDYLQRPLPRPGISLWEGKFQDGQQAGLGIGRAPGSAQELLMVEELHGLREVLFHGNSPSLIARIPLYPTPIGREGPPTPAPLLQFVPATVATGLPVPLATPSPLQAPRRRGRALSPVHEQEHPKDESSSSSSSSSRHSRSLSRSRKTTMALSRGRVPPLPGAQVCGADLAGGERRSEPADGPGQSTEQCMPDEPSSAKPCVASAGDVAVDKQQATMARTTTSGLLRGDVALFAGEVQQARALGRGPTTERGQSESPREQARHRDMRDFNSAWQRAASAGKDERRETRRRPWDFVKSQWYGYWDIDENWVATKKQGSEVIETVQLDPELDAGLGRSGWENRFYRREHQIRKGKATVEYGWWAQYWRQNERFEDDPKTPRALDQTTKGVFEREYNDWRKKLHQRPPRSSWLQPLE